MGFLELKKEVLEKAEKEADRIISEAEADVEAKKDEITAEAKEAEARSEESTRISMEMAEKREIASRCLEAKKALLKAKKRLVDDVFEKAVEDLDKRLTDKGRKALIERLVKKAETEIEIASVSCNKKDKDYVKRYKTNEKKMLGGIIAENKDRTITVDFSFESMIEDIKNTELSKVTEILFN
ncbi:hypothetical protein JXB31_03745 [Candidatus Woesearchaeota archaeon]|nr:hypothetical protein [Candidatus Woesearchaeota archaeon]